MNTPRCYDPNAYYNRAYGILTALKTLEDLNRLAHDRRHAGYVRNERLEEYCVLGRFMLDSSGNTSKITDNAPADHGPVPVVMSRDDVFKVSKTAITTSLARPFPEHFERCSVCGKGWTLEDCHDSIFENEHGEAPLDDFVGKPFSEVTSITSLAGVRTHYVDHEIVINVNGPADGNMRDGRPWQRVDKDYVIKPGDIATLDIITSTHEKCYRENLARVTRERMVDAFTRAGFPNVALISVPNEYWGKSQPYYADPWFLAQVNDGPKFKIGWRKRVIKIDWSETHMDLRHLFPDEDVTKESGFIHAWGYDKAVEYLKKIVPALSVLKG